jgi:hypothetical protein
MDNYLDFGIRITDMEKPLGLILLEAGLINQDQLNEILKLQKQAKADGNRKKFGEIIADRFGIPRTVIEGFYIREQLLLRIKDLFYGTLHGDEELMADKISDATELILLEWESEMTETTHYKENVNDGAKISRDSKLQWVKGDILFKVISDIYAPIEIKVPFSYTDGGQPIIDLFSVVYEIKLHLFSGIEDDLTE